ncbi:polyprotein [Plakobranchus ocellatus]|uniref:Polyprotein n=1 Tax=Plakobranchus ocellatus TaxID=259542 RepID=A0AAV4AJ19_9GAST|nr:polyprotein [Plakobranchus ocellatus]
MNEAWHRILFKDSGQIIMVELTVPYKSRIEEANTSKREKYKDLIKELEKAGYKSQILPIEVVARGFVGTPAYNPLSKLSINDQRRIKALKVQAETVETSSRWIWGRRKEQLLHK